MSEVQTRLEDAAAAIRAKIAAAPDKKAGLLRQMSDGRGDLFRVNPLLIEVADGFNSRDFDHPDTIAHIEWLAGSIAENGVQQPMTVFIDADRVFLSDGECRLRATKLAIANGADIATVPVIVENRYASEADRILSQVNRNGGKPLANFELATVYKKLHAHGWTEAMIATKVGKTIQHVTQYLEMSAMPDTVRAMVNDGRVAFTLAWNVLRDKGGDIDKTEETLAAGIEVAEDSGKKKATRKHISGGGTKKENKLAVGKSILATAVVSKPDRDTHTVTITMDADDYARFKALFETKAKKNAEVSAESVETDIGADDEDMAVAA